MTEKSGHAADNMRHVLSQYFLEWGVRSSTSETSVKSVMTLRWDRRLFNSNNINIWGTCTNNSARGGLGRQRHTMHIWSGDAKPMDKTHVKSCDVLVSESPFTVHTSRLFLRPSLPAMTRAERVACFLAPPAQYSVEECTWLLQKNFDKPFLVPLAQPFTAAAVSTTAVWTAAAPSTTAAPVLSTAVNTYVTRCMPAFQPGVVDVHSSPLSLARNSPTVHQQTLHHKCQNKVQIKELNNKRHLERLQRLRLFTSSAAPVASAAPAASSVPVASAAPAACAVSVASAAPAASAVPVVFAVRAASAAPAASTAPLRAQSYTACTSRPRDDIVRSHMQSLLEACAHERTKKARYER